MDSIIGQVCFMTEDEKGFPIYQVRIGKGCKLNKIIEIIKGFEKREER